MATLTINDLPMNRALDRKAMSVIHGGGAPWVFGWMRPHTESGGGFGGVVNLYQINNYHADQMINQIQVVDVNNSAANSNINVVVSGNSNNSKTIGAI